MTIPASRYPEIQPTRGNYVIRRLATSPMAQAFISTTDTEGGATMDLATGKMYTPGVDRGEVVGAEPRKGTRKRGTSGEPIATHVYAGQRTLSGNQFAHEYLRLKNLAYPGASMGSWRTDRGVDLDASRVYKSRKAASKAVVSRDQDASFDLKTFDDIPYEEHARRIKSDKPQNKKDKVEMFIPSEELFGTKEFMNK